MTNERAISYLAVDLDGTLINTDILYESILQLVASKPIYIFVIIIWLLKGKSFLKMKVANHANIDVTCLPFNFELINWLKTQKKNGKKLVLCTATFSSVAIQVANYIGIFDEVFSSDGQINLSGKNKANLLVCKYGERGFDYVGNSWADLKVWERSANGILVNATKRVLKNAKLVTHVENVFPKRSTLLSYVKLFRFHQWVKNLLIFVPVFAAHQNIFNEVAVNLILGFISLGLCASSIYILNDLLDLQNDRKHPRKSMRPFASGNASISIGLALLFVGVLCSFLIASYVDKYFLFLLVGYFCLTSIYSFGLKRLALLDCLVLAILYTLRIVVGATLVNIELSFWLLAFSIFFFLSLAFVKRFAELKIYLEGGELQKVVGRGYFPGDAPLILNMGVTSGYMSALVMALYINSDNVIALYPTKEVIWFAVPLILMWISWMWLKASRGEMHDDPIVFAIRDSYSVSIGVLFFAVFLIASM